MTPTARVCRYIVDIVQQADVLRMHRLFLPANSPRLEYLNRAIAGLEEAERQGYATLAVLNSKQ